MLGTTARTTWRTHEIVCPHCGYTHRDSYEFGRGGEESGEAECGECEKPFHWTRNVDISYTTSTEAHP